MTILSVSKVQEKVSFLFEEFVKSADLLEQVHALLKKSSKNEFNVYECLFNYHKDVKIQQDFDYDKAQIELNGRFWDSVSKQVLKDILEVELPLRPLEIISLRGTSNLHLIKNVISFIDHAYNKQMNLSENDILNLFQHNQFVRVRDLLSKEYSSIIFEDTPVYLVEIDEVILVIAFNPEMTHKPWHIQVIEKASKKLMKVSADCYATFNEAYKDLVEIYEQSLSNLSDYLDKIKQLSQNDLQKFKNYCEANGIRYQDALNADGMEISFMSEITPHRFECIGFAPNNAMRWDLGFQPWYRQIAYIDIKNKEIDFDGTFAQGETTFENTLKTCIPKDIALV